MIYLCPNTILDDVAAIEGDSRNASTGARHIGFRPDNSNLIPAADTTDFTTNWTGVGINITNDYAHTPFGEKVAARFVASASTNAHDANYTIGTSLSGAWLRMSVLVRYVNYDDFSIAEPQSTVNDLRYDIGADVLHSANAVEDYRAEKLGDGWYFLEIVFDGDAATQKIQLRMTNGDSAADWAASGTEEVWVAQPYAALAAKKRFFYSTADTNLAGDKLIISGAKTQLGRELRVQTDASYTPDGSLTTPTDRHDWNGEAFGDYKCAKFNFANAEKFVIDDANLDTIDTYTTIDFWFAGWARIDKTRPEEVILGRYATAGNRAYYLYWNQSLDRILWSIDDGTTQTDITANIFGAPSDGEWMFISAYHENGVGIGVSVNGGAYNTAAHTTGADAVDVQFVFGDRTANGYYSNWSVMCWATGTTLLDTKGRDYLYNGGKPLLYSEINEGFKTHHGLVSYWDMTEESGNRADSHGSNTLVDTNTVPSDVSVIKSGTGALSLYSSSWVAAGLNDDDLILDGSITAQDVFGVTVGDGASASTTAYTNQISKFYVSDSMSFGSPMKESVRITPDWATLMFKGRAYKIRETAVLNFEYVTQAQVDEIQDHRRLLHEPIYIYDDGGNIFVDKVWHCFLSNIEFTEQHNDYFLMSVTAHRLREYV